MLPLSTVESPAFRRLIRGLCCTQVPDGKSFTLYLDRLYDQMVQRVKETLEKVEYVSTAVDIWIAHNITVKTKVCNTYQNWYEPRVYTVHTNVWYVIHTYRYVLHTMS